MAARWTCSCDHLKFALEMTKMRGDEFDLRKFDPSTYGYRPDAVPDDVLHSDPNCFPLVLVEDFINLFSFALYADGACWGNGTPRARASVGVYGTPDAWYNQGFVLPLDVPQTNQNAEIHSAIAALDVASAILKDRFGSHVYSLVLLVMDSKYVVQAMTEWIRKWRANGFRNARGAPVVNKEALQTLDDKVRRLFEDHLVIVRFWHVPRIHNFGADKLAAEALHGHEVVIFLCRAYMHEGIISFSKHRHRYRHFLQRRLSLRIVSKTGECLYVQYENGKGIHPLVFSYFE